MKILQSSQADEVTPELSPADQLPSPQTQKEIQQKKGICVMIKAKPRKKGKIMLHPYETLAGLFEAAEARQRINKETLDNSQALDSVLEEIFMMLSTIFEEARQMGRSLPMREVKQSVLDEKVCDLAAAAFPEPRESAREGYSGGWLRQS
ncbi:uncharacterized protein LOC141663693 [Apium graveolens]|uniref:uncharacterized protein LOC141663693 n=1 Tax=Apium graveolens TaxID=4045 RepID=UPI003D78D427